MSYLDWIIVMIPLLVVMGAGWYVRRYVKTVADFLTAGRVAGRYLISVSDGVAGIGLVSVVAMFEQSYRIGNSLAFWQSLATPVILIMTLSGFIIYRYRETRAMTLAQFFEIRYSKSFRIFSGILIFISGVLNYAIFPAVSGRFIIYYCRLPLTYNILGCEFSTFGTVMMIFLGVAYCIAAWGGMLTNLVTDCLQGIYSLIVYAIITILILCFFTMDQFKVSMLDRPPGQSLFNPFDTYETQEFNILFILISIFIMVYTRMAHQGAQGYYCSAASPHEQKMGTILGTWRSGMTYLMIPLLAYAAYTYMHNADFSAGAAAVREELTTRINLGSEAVTYTIREQMTVPVVLRHIFPVGVVGLFCSLAIFLLVSTDTTYMQSFGSIFIQDVILPFRRKPFTQEMQLRMLRISIFGVGVFAWLFSYYFGLSTYILMFFSITSSIFVCGAGSCIIGGLYWRRGTGAAAWATMIASALFGVWGFALQKLWPSHIYPFLDANYPGALQGLAHVLTSIGEFIVIASWKVTPLRCPISGREWMLLSSLACIAIYVVVSYLSCKEKFNLDRMLHRGRYNLEHTVATDGVVEPAPSVVLSFWKKYITWNRLLGISPEYTRGDRILAWSVLLYTLINFAIWTVILLYNLCFNKWSTDMWFTWWRYFDLPLGVTIGGITTIWFTWGASRDLIRMFRSLKKLDHQAEDDGRVVAHETKGE